MRSRVRKGVVLFAAAAVSAATLCVLAAPASAGDYRFAYMDGRVKLDDGYVFDLGGGVGETGLGFAVSRHPVRQYNSSIYTIRHGAKVTRTSLRGRLGSAGRVRMHFVQRGPRHVERYRCARFVTIPGHLSVACAFAARAATSMSASGSCGAAKRWSTCGDARGRASRSGRRTPSSSRSAKGVRPSRRRRPRVGRRWSRSGRSAALVASPASTMPRAPCGPGCSYPEVGARPGG